MKEVEKMQRMRVLLEDIKHGDVSRIYCHKLASFSFASFSVLCITSFMIQNDCEVRRCSCFGFMLYIMFYLI